MQLGGLGERCKLPQWGLGQSPSRNQIWCILAWKNMTSGGMATISTIFLRTNWTDFVYKVTFYTRWFAGTLQYQRSGCDKLYLPERRSGSKIFAGTVFRRHYTPGYSLYFTKGAWQFCKTPFFMLRCKKWDICGWIILNQRCVSEFVWILTTAIGVICYYVSLTKST